jgi:hypothetical protein
MEKGESPQNTLKPSHEKQFLEDIRAYWCKILSRVDKNDADGVQRLLLQRRDFTLIKSLGEEEVFDWLQKYAQNHPGYELLVKFDREKAIIVPKEKA